ncbi:MAG: hypothetical protein NZO58_06515, partial [Gemmataceae bacterium]|nr:hypothetical protein [Gemmataceae bacterium]
MRCLFLGVFCAWMLPAAAAGQGPPQEIPDVEVKESRVGFSGGDGSGSPSRYKLGMWCPVYVKIKAGPKGILPKPGEAEPYLQTETDDAEDVGTIYRTPFRMDPNEERWLTTYVRPGHRGQIKVRVVVGAQSYGPPAHIGYDLDLDAHLLVSVGGRMPDLAAAVAALNHQGAGRNPLGRGDPDDPGPRHVGFIDDFDLLPEEWFGYQGVDILFLSTRHRDFLLKLVKDNEAGRRRLAAIGRYVRGGGRLVIGISRQHADLVHQLLQAPVWKPPVPVVPPRDGLVESKKLTGVEAFAGVVGEPFTGQAVRLDPANLLPGAWEVLAPPLGTFNPETDRPLLVRMPYGLGSITLAAFALDEPPLTNWQRGKVEFLKKLILRIGPRSPARDVAQDITTRNDLGTDLQKALDNFNIRIIPFGYVALLIIIYILLVGPVDYLLLKYVFHRLEWTWFTFPTIVAAVSVAAYFTAYAIKGSELRINKVDIVDIDQRTHLTAQGAVAQAAAYGQTFFTILSPQIKNYTIGVEPNSRFWGETTNRPFRADMITWFGRPDVGFGGIGQRGSGPGFFRKPYRYERGAGGLSDVPIPVWTTKSFNATWEAIPIAPPIQGRLSYTRGIDWKVSGTLTNNLGVDLEDVWLFHHNRYFRLAAGFPRGGELTINLQAGQDRSINHWNDAARDGTRATSAQGPYNPCPFVRLALFHERLDQGGNRRNHLLRGLDLS